MLTNRLGPEPGTYPLITPNVKIRPSSVRWVFIEGPVLCKPVQRRSIDFIDPFLLSAIDAFAQMFASDLGNRDSSGDHGA